MIKLLSKSFFFSCLSLFITTISISTQAAVTKGTDESMLVPTGKGWGVKSDHPNKIVKSDSIPENGIFYHGGPVMGTSSSTIPNVYYIWYGNWAGNTAINLLTNFALGVGRTSYYNINTSYTDGNGTPIIKAVNFPKPGFFDKYSQGTTLSEDSIITIVTNAINSKKLPLDSNGIYFVLTSADVNLPGFCTSFCGWHTYTTINNTNIKFAFVGNADRCPNACSAQSTSPNDNLGADAMASVIAHELEETVTDPNLNAWYDNSGEENADKCAWNFGKIKIAPNGSQYNMTIAFKNYLIQTNWLNANNGICVNYKL